MRLRFGMMTPNLLVLAAIAGLRPHGDDFSGANLLEAKVGLDFHKSNKTLGSWVKTYLGHGGDPTDPLSINGVSYTEHVAFLVMWLCKFLAWPKSGGIAKEFQALAEVLADGQQVAMCPIFLAYLYRGLHELYFSELSPTTVCPNDKALLGPPLLNAPRRKYYVEDCFRFFYECQERTREHLSICLDHRFPDYLALVEFKDAKEVTTLTNFNQDLVKSFSISIRDPRFGDSNIFIHWWKEMSAGWFSQPCSEIEDRIFKHFPCSLVFQQEKEKKKAQAKANIAEKESHPADMIKRESSAKSAAANSWQGEKRPNTPIQGSPRLAEHPSSSHSVGAVQLATTSSAAPRAIFGLELSSTDTMAIEAEFQPLFAISSNPPLTCPFEAPQSGPTFQVADVVESTAITVDHAIITSGAPPTIPTDRNAPPEPVLMLTSGAPALVVNATPSELQLEIGESSCFVPTKSTMNPSTDDGRSLAMVPHEEAFLPSLDQCDIFDFLDQWDASISSVEASTRLATSSTMTGALPDSGAEAILQSYKDGDLMSLENKDERNKLKATIETFGGFWIFPQSMLGGYDHLSLWSSGEVCPPPPSFSGGAKDGPRLGAVRQLQERKAGIVAKVSEIIWSNKPLEAQLRQDTTAVGEYRERKLMIQSTLSVGDIVMESFRTALYTLFPDA
ncbi:unnamed protein product [Prunus armeniaca]